jgi:hypothetical protein
MVYRNAAGRGKGSISADLCSTDMSLGLNRQRVEKQVAH